MKNRYQNYRIVLLKSKVRFVASCMEETDPQRVRHTFFIAQVCVCCGKAEEKGWVLLECSWGTRRRIRLLQFRVKPHLQLCVS